MCKPFATSRALVAFGVAALAAIGGNAAKAADVTVSDAKIQAGLLFITGTMATPGATVRLDGQTGAAFNKVSNATTGAFTFNIVYHPGDCIVTALCINGSLVLLIHKAAS